MTEQIHPQDWDLLLIERHHLTGFGAVGPLTQEQTERVESYERYLEESEREHEMEQRTGRKRCPRCDRFTVKVRTFPTRQYGGGFDTTEQCEADDCEYADVFV